MPVQPADPRARRRALWLIGGSTAFGTAGVLALARHRGAIEVWLIAAPGNLALALQLLALATLLPTLGLAGYIWVYARRVLRGQRFPPPGAAVTRPTPIRTHGDARRMAQRLRLLATLLIVTGAGLALTLWQLASTFA